MSIDARGHVAQCDCWVTSYPDYWFGNIFDEVSFTELMQESQARQRFQARPEALMQHESCVECDYLSICRRVSGADVCHYGGLLREGSVLQSLQGHLLHHGSHGGADGLRPAPAGIGVRCRYCKGTIPLERALHQRQHRRRLDADSGRSHATC